MSDAATLTRRVATGRDVPEECFVWWINAERVDGQVDLHALRTAVDEMFDRHWNTRISRGFFVDVGTDLVVSAGSHGMVGETLPFPLHSGTWEFSVRLSAGTWDSVTSAVATLIAPGDHELHRFDIADARREGDSVIWRFDQPYLSFALTLRLELTTTADIVIKFPLRLDLR
jgi:hypothetical protein